MGACTGVGARCWPCGQEFCLGGCDERRQQGRLAVPSLGIPSLPCIQPLPQAQLQEVILQAVCYVEQLRLG